MLVAIEAIGPGTMLTEANTEFREIPLDAIPAGAVTRPEQYQERAILSRAVPNEPIMEAKLGARGVSGASTEIPKGMRVVSVKVNQTTTHSGLMLPGDRVDVLLTFQSRSTSNGRSAMVRKTKPFWNTLRSSQPTRCVSGLETQLKFRLKTFRYW
ncbi:MAG: Flp pilus assembly protein CpaB [Planctomycetaceae bacterium]